MAMRRPAASGLLSLQLTEFTGSQTQVRGFWRAAPGKTECFKSATSSALPPTALLEMLRAFPRHPHAQRWRDAVRAAPGRVRASAGGAIGIPHHPLGVYLGEPSPDRYRALAGGMTYRFFMTLRMPSSENPRRNYSKWFGLTSHLVNYAVALAMAAKASIRAAYRDLAWGQLEWIMGANPFGACLMTGEGHAQRLSPLALRGAHSGRHRQRHRGQPRR